MERDPLDAKGLIRESFRIDGIDKAECRSIFLDWALSLPDAIAPADAIREVLVRHEVQAPDHPMIAVLREGLDFPPASGRRGGARGRTRQSTVR